MLVDLSGGSITAPISLPDDMHKNPFVPLRPSRSPSASAVSVGGGGQDKDSSEKISKIAYRVPSSKVKASKSLDSLAEEAHVCWGLGEKEVKRQEDFTFCVSVHRSRLRPSYRSKKKGFLNMHKENVEVHGLIFCAIDHACVVIPYRMTSSI